MKKVVNHYFVEEKMSDTKLRRKSLILSQRVYQYILYTYGNESEAGMPAEIFLLRQLTQ